MFGVDALYAKGKNVAEAEKAFEGAGDTWTWVALDADGKLVVSYFAGGRGGEGAAWPMDEVAARLANRVQPTSDGHGASLDAVEGRFRP